MIGWQWHQLDDMQIICTSLQTDNHASTSPLSFYRPDALSATQPTGVSQLPVLDCGMTFHLGFGGRDSPSILLDDR